MEVRVQNKSTADQNEFCNSLKAQYVGFRGSICRIWQKFNAKSVFIIVYANHLKIRIVVSPVSYNKPFIAVEGAVLSVSRCE